MLKVVIVEDEYFVRKGMIKTIAWVDMGCQIVGEAGNGREGIEVIKQCNPDLVIADIEMPVIDGIEMLSILRRNHCKADFIFLTAHQKFTYVHEAMKMEAVDYLLKPINHEELLDSIRKVKKRRSRDWEDAVEEVTNNEDNVDANNIYVKKAILYVRKEYANDVTVTSVAQHLNISEAYFCRLFKKETGFTFWQYLTNYRIHCAAGLLSNFPIKVYETAKQCGFTDTNYFSSIFKKIMGVTPTEYQEQNHHYK